jgi:hypothetical protein
MESWVNLAGKLGRIFAAGAAVTAGTAVGVGLASSGSGAALPARATTMAATTAPATTTTCKLGRGVQHVIEIFFDNVHFNRDNPNVPSDLELMPHLLTWLEGNGVVLSNNHTPLIAHTATDSMTTYTGLYGDRAGMPIGNTYLAYNKDGTTDPADSFVYWTDPVDDTASTPNPGHDTNPSMVYSPVPPATAATPVAPTTIAPAPWVPFTRAGCNVGEVASANMDLETTADIPRVFGANSPEAQQLAADKDPYKDPETADYIGIAVHCANGAAFCSTAEAVKYGQKTPTHTETADVLPNEPGGYKGYEALFGHKYVGPQLGAGKANVTHGAYQVTNAKGNLVDLNGNELDGAYLDNYPGFPGYDINASQALAYVADMQETGVPVTYAYISDLHGNEYIPGLAACDGAPEALGSGSACYVAQAQYYDQAFETFFKRLAADGITTKNSLFVFSNDEGDHEAGANVGRAIQPTPANCDGATVSGLVVTPDVACTYPAGSFGELDANINGLLTSETGDTTPFSIQAGVAPQLYVTGDPVATSAEVRTFEHHVAALTVDNPYAGVTGQVLTNYLADPTEEAILHLVNADPARTPTLTLFAKPDFWVQGGPNSCGSSCVTQDSSYAWDHGDYAAEINNNWVGFVGPDVANMGLDGFTPAQGPNSAGANSGQETVPQQSAGDPGTWVDETDIQPTMLYLAGLSEDYLPDGRVISQILAKMPTALAPAPVTALSTCSKQLNSSVGDFGTATLQAATAGIESSTAGDQTYTLTDAALSGLEHARDYLVGEIEPELYGAEFHNAGIPAGAVAAQTSFCNYLLGAAQQLATSTTAATARSVAAHVAVVYAAFRAGRS